MRLLPAVAVLLAAGPSLAHDADILFVRAERGPDGIVHERLTLTPSSLLWLAPIDDDGDGRLDAAELASGLETVGAGVWDWMPLRAPDGECRRTAHTAALRETFVELAASFACPPGELTQTFRALSALPPGYRVVLGTSGDAGARQVFADARQQMLTVASSDSSASASAGEASRGLGGWIQLGVEHIFLGIDHLAFLLAVLLVAGGWKRTLVLVTSFTVAHSITLGATALGVWRLPPGMGRWVEVAIAASIVWVALENLVLRRHAHRAFLTFGFGLVHGFGFASVLAEYGFGDSAAAALFGFNLGVEIGQAAVVLAFAPLAWLLSRRDQVWTWTTRLGSGAVLAAGAMWMVERALG